MANREIPQNSHVSQTMDAVRSRLFADAEQRVARHEDVKYTNAEFELLKALYIVMLSEQAETKGDAAIQTYVGQELYLVYSDEVPGDVLAACLYVAAGGDSGVHTAERFPVLRHCSGAYGLEGAAAMPPFCFGLTLCNDGRWRDMPPSCYRINTFQRIWR